MKKLLFLLLLLTPITNFAQSGKTIREVIYTTGAPSTCVQGKFYIDRVTGAQYVFKTGTGCFTNGTGTGTTTTFTSGSVIFAGTSGVYTQDNASLFFDNTNNRLGINNIVPQTLLHVGAGTDAPALGNSIYASNAGATYIEARDSTNDVSMIIGAEPSAGVIGTRTASDINIQLSGNNLWRFENTTGNLIAVLDNTYDIGKVSSTRPKNIFASAAIVGKSVRGTVGLFSTLPTPPVEGMMVPVTDSSTNVWGATITGGGANHVLAYYNGTNWTVAAK